MTSWTAALRTWRVSCLRPSEVELRETASHGVPIFVADDLSASEEEEEELSGSEDVEGVSGSEEEDDDLPDDGEQQADSEEEEEEDADADPVAAQNQQLKGEVSK